MHVNKDIYYINIIIMTKKFELAQNRGCGSLKLFFLYTLYIFKHYSKKKTAKNRKRHRKTSKETK